MVIDLGNSLTTLHRGMDRARHLAGQTDRRPDLQIDALENLASSCSPEVLRLPPTQCALAALVDAAGRLGSMELQRTLASALWVYLTTLDVKAREPLLTVLYAGI